jgi:hypothetical protein
LAGAIAVGPGGDGVVRLSSHRGARSPAVSPMVSRGGEGEGEVRVAGALVAAGAGGGEPVRALGFGGARAESPFP